ncbi:MAG: hypothetical protein WBO32_08360, partial [Cyclobacteriaceae bacterium]
MRHTKFISYTLFIAVAMMLLTTSCDENIEMTTQEDLLPENFRVEIPASISNSAYAEGGRTKDDVLQG